jgi:hypothetical protein
MLLTMVLFGGWLSRFKLYAFGVEFGDVAYLWVDGWV